MTDMLEKTVVQLSTPITAHDAEMLELPLRAPTTKDLIELGHPLLMLTGEHGSVGIEVRQSVVAGYISRLAAIPKSSVESLSLADFSRCSAVVMGFLPMDGGLAAHS